MYKELLDGKHWCYEVEDGGVGIVKANTIDEAISKVKEAYMKHGGIGEYTDVWVWQINQKPFEDAHDVIEIREI